MNSTERDQRKDQPANNVQIQRPKRPNLHKIHGQPRSPPVAQPKLHKITALTTSTGATYPAVSENLPPK